MNREEAQDDQVLSPVQTRLVLVDPKVELCAHWETEFAGVADCTVVRGRFEDLDDYDCLVSPANSFGLMDGGVDFMITRHFGSELMERVQARILREFRGEQPVGTSIIVETGSEEHPFLAHTPTMRVPMAIDGTDNVYSAMFAMLLAVERHNATHERPIETIACPGLGTGCGRVESGEAARQMALAVKHFRSPPGRISWVYAWSRQSSIARDGGGPFTVG